MRNINCWKKWAVVFLVFLALNTSQIVGEFRTNFSNTKTLFGFVFSDSNSSASVRPNVFNVPKLQRDLDCHIEANFFLISSYGEGQCTHDFMTVPTGGIASYYFKNLSGNFRLIILLASLIFSIVGYFLLFYYCKNESDKAKRHLLGFIIIYFAIGFIIMWPLSRSDINDIRYFVFGFFMPFLFLGFLIKFIWQKKIFGENVVVIAFAIVIFGLFVVSNLESLSAEAKPFLANNVTCSSLYQTTLGELEPVVKHMASYSGRQNQIYIGQNDSQRIVVDAAIYLLKKQNIDAVKFTEKTYSAAGNTPVFYLSCKVPKVMPENTLAKTNIAATYQKIGQLYVYRLDNLYASN